jgi:hypothetical protein
MRTVVRATTERAKPRDASYAFHGPGTPEKTAASNATRVLTRVLLRSGGTLDSVIPCSPED